MLSGSAYTPTSESPAVLAERLAPGERLLLVGEPGIGKSTLLRQLGAELAVAGRPCQALTADPGSPAFGVPGALALGEWGGDDWRPCRLEALCSLDAGRFRLPLAVALQRLLAAADPQQLLLVDAPGLVRGAPGAELLEALVAAVRPTEVLVLGRPGGWPLRHELAALSAPVRRREAAAAAHSPSKEARAWRRSQLWEAYLAGAQARTLALAGLPLLGTPPPPLAAAGAWRGRQIALLERGRTLALGEVIALQRGRLQLRVPPCRGRPDALLVRDAGRDQEGLLRTRRRPEAVPAEPVAAAVPRLLVGAAEVELVNGVTGDPLVRLRLPQRRRSLLFDLGESARLPAAAVHQIGDVFISHAHIDHIAGFLWLLRARIGLTAPCRLYGPPGLAANIDGLLRGVLWDRIGARGPVFEVHELHAGRLRRFRAQAGQGCERLGEQALSGGNILVESGFAVQAVTLDHLGTASVAYALQPAAQVKVRRERLAARGLAPGPWLGELKARLQAADTAGEFALPDGRRAPLAQLQQELLRVEPGRRFAYATDFADTPDNRRRLVELARGADLFVCEASFREAEAEQAARTGHLTARACGEIATAAGVRRLLPFHFSRRYERDPQPLLAEVAAACPRTLQLQ